MSTDAIASVISRAELATIYREHRHLRMLLGMLGRSRDWRECRRLLDKVDQAFDAHSAQEALVLQAVVSEKTIAFLEMDQSQHSRIEDLLFELGNFRLSNDAFQAKAALLHEAMCTHIVQEEDYLRSPAALIESARLSL